MASGIIISITFFILMELVAYLTHKYIMHGPLWVLHKSHHNHKKKLFELNDLFSVFFASIAILLINEGFNKMDWRFFAGVGMTAYGLAYFFVHDIFVHARIKGFSSARSVYFKAIRKAHKIHHKHPGKENAEEFGFLWVSPKWLAYYKKNTL